MKRNTKLKVSHEVDIKELTAISLKKIPENLYCINSKEDFYFTKVQIQDKKIYISKWPNDPRLSRNYKLKEMFKLKWLAEKH